MLESVLQHSEDDPPIKGSYVLSDHGDAKLSYSAEYQEYHRMGEIKHGIEVIFRPQNEEELVEKSHEHSGQFIFSVTCVLLSIGYR